MSTGSAGAAVAGTISSSRAQKKQEKAMNDFNKAIKCDDKFFDAHYFCASYFFRDGKYSTAIEFCDSALAIEPFSINTLMLRGSCRCKINQYREAIEDFNLAIEKDKSNPRAFYNRAMCFQLTGDVDQAIRDYSVTLLMEEDSVIILFYFIQG